MRKRQIKKTVIKYEEQPLLAENKDDQRQRSRSREKQSGRASHREETVKIQQVNVNSRRARLEAMRKAREQEESLLQNYAPNQFQVKIQEPIALNIYVNQHQKNTDQRTKEVKKQVIAPKKQVLEQEQQPSQDEQQVNQRVEIIKKPVFIAKQYREDKGEEEEELRQEQRRKKNVKYTTKMLLQQQKYEDSQEQNQNSDSQNDLKANAIVDDDTVDEQLQFQLWKIRELNRIRRDREQRRKLQIEKAQISRRRQMTNQAVLLQNRQLGSDATESNSETKYVYMQKYYHRGAFYQDSDDQIFKRDFNLPTPMQMQDKSLLPQILQKRIGNFGKKGQSKYTHLTAEDTSDLNPLTRPDESILQFWKRRTAGYKGSYSRNV